MNNENRFYVYLHRDMNGVVFYIGKGTGDRYKRKNNRSTKWQDIAKSGFTFEIVQDGLDEDSALSIEKELISDYSSTVVNVVKSSTTRVLDFNDLNSAFYYDENSPSGLCWRVSRTNGWCPLVAGTPSGSVKYEENGSPSCWMVKHRGLGIGAHRVIWVLLKGSIPSGLVIDHLDGNPLNNRIDNLKIKTRADNTRNRKSTSNLLTGVTTRLTPAGGRNYTANWTVNGVLKTRTFAVNKYGEDAYRLACEVRLAEIEKLVAKGLDYTDRHVSGAKECIKTEYRECPPSL